MKQVELGHGVTEFFIIVNQLEFEIFISWNLVQFYRGESLVEYWLYNKYPDEFILESEFTPFI